MYRLSYNTPLYGINSVPLITMIEQKNFEQVMKYIATILEHIFLYIQLDLPVIRTPIIRTLCISNKFLGTVS